MSATHKPTEQTYNIEGFLDYYCRTHDDEIQVQFLNAKRARERRQDRRNKGLIASASVLLTTVAGCCLFLIMRPEEVGDGSAGFAQRVVGQFSTVGQVAVHPPSRPEDLVLEDPDEQAEAEADVALANLSPTGVAVDPRDAMIDQIIDELINLKKGQLSPATIGETDPPVTPEVQTPQRKQKKKKNRRGGSSKDKKTAPEPPQEVPPQDEAPKAGGTHMEQTIIIDDGGVTYYSERAIRVGFRNERHKQAVMSCIQQGEDVETCVERFRNPSDRNKPLRPSQTQPQLEVQPQLAPEPQPQISV
jgi:hypothetical protein